MAAWRSSGQTQAAFAREREIRLGTLRRWVYRSEAAGTRGAKVDFREVKNLAGVCRLKILFWDGAGLCLFCKRLERGTYAWPGGQDSSRALRPEELQLLVHGIDGQPRQRWYRSV